jgi:hypothetical protein
MLLDALQKAPPHSLHDMRVFFDRSRSRLEQSLDKGQVSDSERATYLEQFEAGVSDAQMMFLDEALHQRADAAKAGKSVGDGDMGKPWFKLPLVWAVVACALVVGLVLGVLIGR